MPTTALLHLDQGISVTSHASQGKTVDNVIVSAPVAAFAQVSQAQLYVSMSRARRSMHLLTDCKEALREAVCRPGALAKYLSRRSSASAKKPAKHVAEPHGQVKTGTKEPEHRESGTGPK